MKEFLIVAKVTVSTYTKVEAENIEDAIEIAKQRSFMGVHNNGGDSEFDSWMIDEIDGEPFDLHEE